jgi:5-methylcytosine-specific restriction endonuclease McrA
MADKKEKKPRPPATDNQLIKGALRRAFARSMVHDAIISATIVQGYSDPNRKRVKTWCRCPNCGNYEAKSYMQVDHLDPVQPLGVTLEEMDKHELMDRIWCSPTNLMATCKTCHRTKTNAENAERRKIRNAKKKTLR